MKIISLVLFLFFTRLFAMDITLVPYVAYSEYQKDAKDKALIRGVYTKFTNPKYSVELNIEKTNLDYNRTYDTTQNDFVLAYSQLLSNNYKFHSSLHYISSDNNQSDKTKVIFLGLQRFKQNKFDLGIEFAYSRYEETALAENIGQARVYGGLTFGDYKSMMGKYIAKLGATLLYPEYTNSNSSLKSNYSSYDISLTQFKGAFINKVSYWYGEQLYGVRDRGFVVYNLNELHESGIYISSRYSLYEDMGLSLTYTKENFNDLDTNIDDCMERILLSFDYTIR